MINKGACALTMKELMFRRYSLITEQGLSNKHKDHQEEKEAEYEGQTAGVDVDYYASTTMDRIGGSYYGSFPPNPFDLIDEEEQIPSSVDEFTLAQVVHGAQFMRAFNKYRRLFEYEESYLGDREDEDAIAKSYTFS